MFLPFGLGRGVWPGIVGAKGYHHGVGKTWRAVGVAVVHDPVRRVGQDQEGDGGC